MTIWVAQCATIHSPRRWRCAVCSPKEHHPVWDGDHPTKTWKSMKIPKSEINMNHFRMIPLYPDGIPYVPHIPMIFVVGSVLWRKFFAPCNTQQKLVTPLDSVGEVYWYGSKLQTNWDHRFGQNVLIWLVVYLPLWKILVSWDYDIPNIRKNTTCSKPPTSNVWTISFSCFFRGTSTKVWRP